MIKKIIVISLGGSLIVPRKIDYQFLKRFGDVLKKNYYRCKFVVVCGGGTIARKYITILKKRGRSKREIALAGMRATRMNAKLMMQFFSKEANTSLPSSMKDIKDLLNKNKVVFCGALRYAEKETSDGTAAKLAHYFNTYFINITNVKGLYNSNPETNKNAKFIPKESWENFEKRALKIKFKLGQHFILDQNTATTIKKRKIKTYIIGKDTTNLNKLLNNKKFVGTIIEG